MNDLNATNNLIVLHCIHSLSWGGLEMYTTELILKLASTGIKQKVFCLSQGRVYEELKKHNIEVLLMPGKETSLLGQARWIYKTIKEHKITLLHSHTRLDMWACALALWNNKKSKHVYNLYMNATNKQDFVHRWLFSKIDVLCSSSETILNEARKNFPIAPEKLQLMRYGRKVEDFKPNLQERIELRERFHVQPNQIVIGTLCRIDPGKGVRELVQALDHLEPSELARVQLWIIGDPTISGKNDQGKNIFETASKELYDWIQAKRREDRYRDHLIYIPFQTNYIPYLDALDVFCLASHKETYSLSVLDAMMMAKPVIGTNAGGTPEQVGHNERGFLAEPRSPESLAQALRFYLKDPAAIQAQGLRGQVWSKENHDWKKTLQGFLKIYSELTVPSKKQL
jgi:hypothetical protein